MFATYRVLSLSSNPDYAAIHGFSSVFEMPIYHEIVTSSFINLIAGIYILTTK